MAKKSQRKNKNKALGRNNTPKKEIRRKEESDESEDEEDYEEVNYAAGADAFASDNSQSEGGEEEESSENDGKKNSSSDDDDDDDASDDDDEEHARGEDKRDDESSSDDDDSDEGEDVTAVFKGVAMKDERSEDDSNSDDDDEESSDDDEPKEQRRAPATVGINNTSFGGNNEICTFDLRNLVAVNSHQIASSSLVTTQKKKKNSDNNHNDSNNKTIPSNDSGKTINEDFLLKKATEGCSQLIQALWQLPTEKSDAGPMVQLPSYDEIRLPRALPPPPPKQETKWEKFAKEKGIPLNKEKRSRKVWDEVTGTWMYRHGYQKANKDASDKEWPIMEVKDNEDPFADPWEKLRDAKRARKDKNLESRLRNEERAGTVPKGTTNRVVKSRDKVRQAGKRGGNIDRDSALPVGIPVDLKPDRKTSTNPDSNGSKLRGKTSTLAALAATQRSTASLGMFDAMREGEPERKKSLSKLKKRKLQTSTDKKVLSTEGERSMKILKTVVDSTTGTVSATAMSKDKLRRKGQFAKGETAYDYDFDDGLGPSTFHKKKGRAGAGKMRKMTKKRVK